MVKCGENSARGADEEILMDAESSQWTQGQISTSLPALHCLLQRSTWWTLSRREGHYVEDSFSEDLIVYSKHDRRQGRFGVTTLPSEQALESRTC